MKLAAATALAAFLIAAAPALAQRDGPIQAPKKADRMTQNIAHGWTYNRIFREIHNHAKWPGGIVPTAVEPCEIPGRWKGVCDYRISGPAADGEGGTSNLTRRCVGTVTVRINKQTRRIWTRKVQEDCTDTLN